jgi:hypothetical protein
MFYDDEMIALKKKEIARLQSYIDRDMAMQPPPAGSSWHEIQSWQATACYYRPTRIKEWSDTIAYYQKQIDFHVARAAQKARLRPIVQGWRERTVTDAEVLEAFFTEGLIDAPEGYVYVRPNPEIHPGWIVMRRGPNCIENTIGIGIEEGL